MYTKEQYEKAFILRKKGFTYLDISKNLNITYPRTTFGWIKEGILPRGRFLNPEFDKLTPELGYILGVIHGDGYLVIKRTKGRVGLEVIDKDFAQNFHNQLEKWSGLEFSFYFNKNKGLYTAVLYSLRAARFLKDFNIYNLVDADNEIKANFLRGLFDSEGNVSASNLETPKTATRFISFFNNDKKLIDLTKTLLESLGIKVQNVDKRVGGGFKETTINFRLRIGGFNNLELFRNKIGFSIERKNKKLEELLASYFKYHFSTVLQNKHS